MTPILSPSLPTIRSHLHTFDESLGDFRGRARKIMWSHFFDHAFYFVMAFDEFKRLLTLFASSFLVFSDLHNSEIYAVTYDKLLRVLTAFKLQS